MLSMDLKLENEDIGWLCWYQATYLGTPVRVARIPPGCLLQMEHACSPESGSMRIQLVWIAPDPSQTWHLTVPSRLQPVQFLPVPLHSSHLTVPRPRQVGHSFMIRGCMLMAEVDEELRKRAKGRVRK